MAETQRGNQPRRIVAAVPASGQLTPLLRLAARMAERSRADLAAVLVQSEVLETLAALPVTRHLVGPTGQAEKLTPRALELALTASASRLQDALGAMLRGSASRLTLHTLSSAAALDRALQAREEDLLIADAEASAAAVGPWQAGERERAVAALAIAGRSERRQDIVVLCADGDSARRALVAARLLAAAQDGICRIVLPLGQRAALADIVAAELGAAELGAARIAWEAVAAGSAALPASVALARDIGAGFLVLPAAVLRQDALAPLLARRSGA